MTRAWVGGGALFALSIAAAGCGGLGTTQDAGLGGGGGTAQGQGGQASGGSLGSAGAAGGGHPGSGGAGGQLATGGAAGAGGGLGGGGSGVNCIGKQTLVEGTKNLLDVFVAQAGVIVVDNASVSLIGRDATVLRSVPFTRQITAAAFDGTTLVIADTAKLTVMSPALDVGPTATLVATCADAVLLGGNDLVCAPNGDTGRIYATYDVSTNPPMYLTNSGGYLYEGTPMFPVPGTTEFVTVTLEKAPPSFELFQVASTGFVTWSGSSPFDSYAATPILAFDGTPATHMIQQQGDILGITANDCPGGNFGCFPQTGALGTLQTGQSNIAMADDGAGKVIALVSSSPSANLPDGTPCASGCPLQLIDIATQTIALEQTYTIGDLSTVVRARYDPACATAILGYTTIAAGATATNGYRVQQLAF